MSLALTASLTAISPGLNSYFLGTGGVEPYTYAVLAGGAGGTIDPDSGFYTAPASADPEKPTDTIEVTDADANTARLKILVGSALLLFCDIIQKEMGLADGRVYLWDQKLMQPTDKDIYIAVSEIQCKPFGNTNRFNGSTHESDQSVNMLSVLGIDIISRGPAARDRKADVLMALQSTYSEQQQEANSFFIGKLPSAAQFIVLNEVDGAAIPYRYRISINMQYVATKNKAVSYFDDFDSAETTTEP